MLGQFLEYSLPANPLAASFEFYLALGFVSIPVSDTLPHAYVVLFDGALTVGLHDREQSGAHLTFVRPGLRDYVRPLRRLGIELHHERLRDNEFNSVSFVDPGGQEVELIEARTFPPASWSPSNVAACGTLLEISLPTAELAASSRFWQTFGFAPVASGEAPHPWQRLAGRGLAIGLHETHFRPGLSFRCDDLAARGDYLRAKGLALRSGNPLADRAQHAATLTAPEGTSLYLFESRMQ
jgi:hypothetical protein